MNATTVIRKPLVTEKNTYASGELNRYTFEVDPKATKPQIRRAIKELYEVRVVGVSTLNRRGTIRRNRNGQFLTGKHKRAIVKVHPEDRIELF